MKKLIILLAIVMLTGCTGVKRHLWGYEKSVYVKDAEPTRGYVYIPTSSNPYTGQAFKNNSAVHERALYLASIQYPNAPQGYENGWPYVELDGEKRIISVGFSQQGMWLEIGVDPEWP